MKPMITRDQLAELQALADMPDSEIDTDDIPEVLDWSDAVRGPLTPEKRAEMVAKWRLKHPEAVK